MKDTSWQTVLSVREQRGQRTAERGYHTHVIMSYMRMVLQVPGRSRELLTKVTVSFI